MKKKWFFLLYIIIIAQISYAQDSITETFYKSYSLMAFKIGQKAEPGKDKMDIFNEQDRVEKANLKEGEFYFLVKKKGDQILSVGYYDHKGNIQRFLLDRVTNVYFNYVTYQYKDGILISKEYKNTADFVLAKIVYEYNEQKKMNKSKLFVYSLTQRKLIQLEETNYYYTGDNYDFVERYNMRNQTYEKFIFKSTAWVQEYERYDIDGKTLQYRVRFFYDGETLARKEYYSRTDVLLKTIHEKKTAAN